MKTEKINSKDQATKEPTLFDRMARAHHVIFRWLEEANNQFAEFDEEYPIIDRCYPYKPWVWDKRDMLIVIKAARKRCLEEFFSICADRKKQVVFKSKDAFKSEICFCPTNMKRAMRIYKKEYLEFVDDLRNIVQPDKKEGIKA